MNNVPSGRKARPGHAKSAKQTKGVKRMKAGFSSIRQGTEGSIQPVERMALSVTEAMDVLNLGRPALYRLLMSKRLGSIRVGGRRIIPVSAIQAFLNRELVTQAGESGGGDGLNA